MDKRYQVFISSTYADLKGERQSVLKTLMEMDCIPAGMELFPAADLDQFEFIQSVIDDCDYYLLVIGGRYGSLSNDGISYTEMEYDYAVEKGIPVVALIHKEPGNIPSNKTDEDLELRGKLEEFKDKVKTGRLVQFWKNEEELPGKVALSLMKEIKRKPGIGWVRGNVSASADLLQEINELRKENKELQETLKKKTNSPVSKIKNLAKLDNVITVEGTYKTQSSMRRNNERLIFEAQLSWKKLFSLVAPYLREIPHEDNVRRYMSRAVFEMCNLTGYSPEIYDQPFKTIALQLESHNLIKTKLSNSTDGIQRIFWILTEEGRNLMFETRTIKDSAPP